MKHLKLKSRFIIIVLALTILNVLNVHAQNKNVSGTVLDNSGQPVIGASVVVVGQSKLGTVTDIDGKFSIAIPTTSKKIEVSYIGMVSQVIEAKAGTPMKIIMKDNFVKVFESKGGTIVAEEGYTAGDTDFTAQLTKIKEAQPQIIFTPIFYQDFIMIHKQARTLGIEVPMLGGDGCASEVLFDAADAVDGSYVINHVSLVDPAGDAFRKEYAEKYNGAKMELNGYMAHDAFLLWCAAVEKAGSDDPQAIADAYSQVEVEGMAGKIKISAEDHNPVGKSGCVERIDGKNKTYVFETYIAAD